MIQQHRFTMLLDHDLLCCWIMVYYVVGSWFIKLLDHGLLCCWIMVYYVVGSWFIILLDHDLFSFFNSQIFKSTRFYFKWCNSTSKFSKYTQVVPSYKGPFHIKNHAETCLQILKRKDIEIVYTVNSSSFLIYVHQL
jgi:hypothetical protein